MAIVPMVYSLKFVTKGHNKCISILLVSIWIFLAPLNLLFVLGQALLYTSTQEYEWAATSYVGLIGQIIISWWAVKEAYWHPVN